MPARKKASQTRKGLATKGRKTGKASAARVKGGPLPPYGVPIRQAIARGDVREMKALAASTRKWLGDISTALAKLESSVRKAGA